MRNATDDSDTRQAPVNTTDRILVRPLRHGMSYGRTWVWHPELLIVEVDAALDAAQRERAVDEAFAAIRAGVVWQAAGAGDRS